MEQESIIHHINIVTKQPRQLIFFQEIFHKNSKTIH